MKYLVTEKRSGDQDILDYERLTYLFNLNDIDYDGHSLEEFLSDANIGDITEFVDETIEIVDDGYTLEYEHHNEYPSTQELVGSGIHWEMA